MNTRIAPLLWMLFLVGITVVSDPSHPRLLGQELPRREFAEAFQKKLMEKDLDGAAQILEEASSLSPVSLMPYF